MIATIPFQFSAGKATLPAGEYELTCSDRGLLAIRSKARKVPTAMVFINRIRGTSQDRMALVFHRYGSRSFLVQSWAGDAGVELQTIHAERALKHESVSLKPRAEMVSLKFKTRDREPTESSQQ